MKNEDAAALMELAGLLAYPRAGLGARIERALLRLAASSPETATLLRPFSDYAAFRPLSDVEESFTQTFDLDPACALEVGWHLYGEDYKRGEFLVEMRQAMRRLGVPEDTELPDHLTHVLAVLARLEGAEADRLAVEKVLPALAKMRPAAAGKPYGGVLDAVDAFLAARFAAPAGGGSSR